MPIRDLQLFYFKHLQRLELEDLPERGLIVVSGPNEAGKSTLREAMTWALFGGRASIEAEVAVRLAIAGAGAVEVRREGGRVVVKRDGVAEGGDATDLSALLRGLDARVFRAIFAFDAFALQELSGLDDAGLRQRLAAAGLEGHAARPSHQVVAALREAEERLWRPRASSPLRESSARVTELRRRLRQAQAEVGRLGEVERRLRQAQAQVTDREAALREADRSFLLLSGLETALPLRAELTIAEQALARLAPPRCGRAALEAAQRLFDEMSENRAARDAVAEAVASARLEAARWVPDRGLLAQAASLEAQRGEAARIGGLVEERERLALALAGGEEELAGRGRLAPAVESGALAGWLAQTAANPALEDLAPSWATSRAGLAEAVRTRETWQLELAEATRLATAREAALEAQRRERDGAITEADAEVARVIGEEGRLEELDRELQGLEAREASLAARLGGHAEPLLAAFPALGEADLGHAEGLRNRAREARVRHETRRAELQRTLADSAARIAETEARREVHARVGPAPISAERIASFASQRAALGSQTARCKALLAEAHERADALALRLGGDAPLASHLDAASEGRLREAEDAVRTADEALRRASDEASRLDGVDAPGGVAASEARRGQLVALRTDLDQVRGASRAGADDGAPRSRLQAGAIVLVAVALLAAVATTALVAAWIASAVVTLLGVVALVVLWRARAPQRGARASDTRADEEAIARQWAALGLRGGPEGGALAAELDAVTRALDRARDRAERQAAATAEVERREREWSRAATVLEAARASLGLPAGVSVAAWFELGRAIQRELATIERLTAEAAGFEVQRAEIFGELVAAAGAGLGARGDQEAALELALSRLREVDATFRRAHETVQVLDGELASLRALAAEEQRALAGLDAAAPAADERAEWQALLAARGWPAAGGEVQGPDDAWLSVLRRAHGRQQLLAELAEVTREREARQVVVSAMQARRRTLAERLGEADDARLGARLVTRRAAEARAQARLAEAEELVRLAKEVVVADEREVARSEREVARHAHDEAAFEAWREAVDAPVGLLSDRAAAWVSEVREAHRVASALGPLRVRLEVVEAEIAAWHEAVSALGAPRERPFPERAAWLEAQVRALRAAELAAVRHEEATAALTLAEARLVAAETRLAEREARWSEASQALDLPGPAEVADELARGAAWQQAERALDEARERLARAVGHDPDGTRRAALDGDLAPRLLEARELRDTCDADRLAAREAREAATEALEALTASSDVTTLETELAAAVEVHEGLWRDWARARIARALVEDTVERLRRERQPEVLKRASRWFARATAGAYTAIEAPDLDRPLDLQLRDRAGYSHPVEPGALSTGTLGLVHLCLRLGLALEHGARTVRLPILLDDVLAHLDPERAAEAARVLADVAAETQVWLFTCRDETVDVVARAAPGVHRVALARWAGRDGPAPRHAERTPRRGRPAASAPRLQARADPLPESRADGELATAALDAPLEAALSALEAGGAMRSSGLREALGLSEAEWPALRRALEGDARVEVSGEKRGRTYQLAPRGLPGLGV
jgi:uncharacterized protein YhaN